MEENLIGGAAIIAAFLFLFYINKWDLVDMTGLAKKQAISGMPALSESLQLAYEPGRTPTRQGELQLQRQAYTLKALPDLSRIEITFRRPMGIYLLSSHDKRSNDRAGKTASVSFQSSAINAFFTEKTATNAKAKQWLENSPAVALALTTFIQQWDGRKLSSFALRDDTLHVVFAYDSYLPIALLKQAVPDLLDVADALSAMSKGAQ